MFCYENLENYFRTNFILMHHYKYNLADLENMIPWERQVYISLLELYIAEQNSNNYVGGNEELIDNLGLYK
jgi:hypothetical protein